jgi:hypothetical protein
VSTTDTGGADRDVPQLVSFLKQSGYKSGAMYDFPSIVGGRHRSLHLSIAWTHPTRPKIDILISSCYQILLPVLAFHSTIVRNIVTRDHVIVLHPTETFAAISLARNNIEPEVIAKYEARGITFKFGNSDAQLPCGSNCPSSRSEAISAQTCLVVAIGSVIDRRTYALPQGFVYGAPFECTNPYCYNRDGTY